MSNGTPINAPQPAALPVGFGLSPGPNDAGGVGGTSGGGAVTATMNGKKQLLKLHIEPAAVVSLGGSQPDVEMLEDLVIAAVNEAGRKADEAIQSNVKGMLGGLNIPGLT